MQNLEWKNNTQNQEEAKTQVQAFCAGVQDYIFESCDIVDLPL